MTAKAVTPSLSECAYSPGEYENPAYEAELRRIEAEILSRRIDCETLSRMELKPHRWFWHGYIGPGKMTLMTSQWKAGKTTLISILLQRMKEGGRLAGLPVEAGRAAVICEEGPDNWRARQEKLGLGKYVSLFPRPFRYVPTLLEWRGTVRAMLTLRRREGLDLVVIDPLAVFLPGSNENAGAGMMKFLLCLRQMTDEGLAVVLLHHPKKGITLPGQAARGSGVLPAYVDIIVEKTWYGKPNETDRRRRLASYSRHEQTPRQLVLELNPEGTDYTALEVTEGPESSTCWNVLRMVLEDTVHRMTQKMILEEWPEDFSKPDKSTVWRMLQRGVELGHMCQAGSGRKNDPFRYWLREREEDVHPGEDASEEAKERWHERWKQQFWAGVEALAKKNEEAEATQVVREGPSTAPTADPEKPEETGAEIEPARDPSDKARLPRPTEPPPIASALSKEPPPRQDPEPEEIELDSEPEHIALENVSPPAPTARSPAVAETIPEAASPLAALPAEQRTWASERTRSRRWPCG